MTQKDNGGPAFPQKRLYRDSQGMDYEVQETGMTLRAYAAVHLQQPDSGIDWLDAMILSAKRDAISGQALAGLFAGSDPDRGAPEDWAKASYVMADAMLAERSK